jgi:hypothetical protein
VPARQLAKQAGRPRAGDVLLTIAYKGGGDPSRDNEPAARRQPKDYRKKLGRYYGRKVKVIVIVEPDENKEE